MSAEDISVLLVEDNPGDACLFREALKEAYGSKFNLVHCTTLAQALRFLGNTQPDVIVVDLGLPDALGIEVVKRTHGMAPTVPLVVLTSRADDALGLQALNAGAQDYLVKGELDPRLLSRALRYAMERQRMRLALQSESLLDELTRLYNRRGFLVLAGNHFKLAERTRQPFALVFIDLDGMKQINDTLGHIEGDRALVEAAELLSSCVRQSDIVARFGGDELCCFSRQPRRTPSGSVCASSSMRVTLRRAAATGYLSASASSWEAGISASRSRSCWLKQTA